MSLDPGNYDHFRGTFDRHVVRSEVRGEGFGSWLIMCPHHEDGWEWTFWVRITACDGNLTVTGDFDPVTFSRYSMRAPPEAVVAWMGSCNFLSGYVCEKASIGTGREAVTEISVEAAHADIRSTLKDLYEQLDAALLEYNEDIEAQLAEREEEGVEGQALETLRADLEGEADSEEIDTLRDEIEAYEAGLAARTEGYVGAYAAADIVRILDEIDGANSFELERCDLGSFGERPAMRVELAHLAVRRLHELLEERPPERTRFERVQRFVMAWFSGGVLALLQGEHV